MPQHWRSQSRRDSISTANLTRAQRSSLAQRKRRPRVAQPATCAATRSAAAKMVRRSAADHWRVEPGLSFLRGARPRSVRRDSGRNRGLVRCARTGNPELRRRCQWDLFPVPWTPILRFEAAWIRDDVDDVRPRRSRARRLGARREHRFASGVDAGSRKIKQLRL